MSLSSAGDKSQTDAERVEEVERLMRDTTSLRIAGNHLPAQAMSEVAQEVGESLCEEEARPAWERSDAAERSKWKQPLRGRWARARQGEWNKQDTTHRDESREEEDDEL